MRSFRTRRFLVAAVAAPALLALGALDAPGDTRKPIAFPEGYRGWTHVKSMVIHDKSHPLFDPFGGIHHVYVNDAGITAVQQSKSYPDGSVLVFDLLEAGDAGGAMVEGARKFVGVMVKNAKAYAETGGWGFEVFPKDTKKASLTDGGASCWTCHAGQAKTDGVFSTYRP